MNILIMKHFLTILVLLCSTCLAAQTILIPFKSTWKYLDNGSNQGTAWRATSFNDASWKSGPGELGYGDGDEATVVGYGPSSFRKYITTYFRKTLSLSDPGQYSSFAFSLTRDDGAVVYINGVEVYRTNLPTGTITYTTLASPAGAYNDGKPPVVFTVPASAFVAGTNVIAVEVHQNYPSTPDMSFDLQLNGSFTPPACGVPSGLTATNITTSSATLSWTAVSSASGYTVQYRENGTTTWVITTSATTSVALSSLSAATQYEFHVQTVCSGSTSAYSALATFTTLAPPPTCDAPSGLAASNVTSSAATLNWTAVSGASGYTVQYRPSGTTTWTTTTSAANSVSISALLASTQYEFQVQTQCSGSSSAYSASATFTTQAPPPSEGPVFIAFGSVWRYLDNGSNQGTAWRATSFSDDSWKSGPGELGYGDGDEATVVGYGPSSSRKYITTYFRKAFSLSDPLQYASYQLSLTRDDGAVVYINGVEVYRTNMPTGTISYTTQASPAGAYNDGKPPVVFNVAASAFVAGTNVIAVEVHQNYPNTPDMSFDLELVGGNIVLTRGPYLQLVGPTAATLRWRTNMPTDSRIEAGTTAGTYTLSATDPTATTEHEVRITGLSPDTRYYYRVGSSTQALQSGSGYYFTTAPPATTTRTIRIAAFGDPGQVGTAATTVQANVLAAYLNYVGSNPAEVMLTMGDNTADSGTDAVYQSNFFAPFKEVLKNHVLFPVPGNHDYTTTARTARTGPYYKNFTLPAAGECGGVASGTESFYSWNWGPVHFLSLDSYGAESADNSRLYDTLGPQVSWVKKDLEANTSKWTVVYWHHPPYTMGSHNSDTESELIYIRQNFIPILERYGVDLVLCAHSHVYERSYLLRGYYGNEASFNVAAYAVSASSGKYDGTANSCPFITGSGQYSHGTVYAVSGTSAHRASSLTASFPHDALPFATTAGGMLYLEVEDNRLDARMISETGAVFDQFTILKDVNQTTNLTLAAGQAVTLRASWPGTYQWSTGETTRSITVAPSVSTTYTVQDAQGCLTDGFAITVATTTARSRTPEPPPAAQVYPTLVSRGQVVTLRTPGGEKPVEAVLLDNSGRRLRTFKVSGTGYIDTRNLAPGTYYLLLRSAGTANRQRFIVTD